MDVFEFKFDGITDEELLDDFAKAVGIISFTLLKDDETAIALKNSLKNEILKRMQPQTETVSEVIE